MVQVGSASGVASLGGAGASQRAAELILAAL